MNLLQSYLSKSLIILQTYTEPITLYPKHKLIIFAIIAYTIDVEHTKHSSIHTHCIHRMFVNSERTKHLISFPQYTIDQQNNGPSWFHQILTTDIQKQIRNAFSTDKSS